MNWRETEYNRKGFLHHSETPLEDKFFYQQHKEKALQLMYIGQNFLNNNGVYAHRSLSFGKEENGTMSRNLHRGALCPSPVLDIIITNSKRGKILSRPSKKSKITNRYVFDALGKLIFVDNYIEGKMVSSEYLIYQGCVVYGITVGMRGRLICVSEELYSNNRLESYICAYYSGVGDSISCHQMDCEEYHYETGLMDWDYYQLHYGWEQIAPSGFIKHNRYRFTHNDGWLKEFIQVNIDGTPIHGSTAKEVTVKRKG